MKKHFFDTSALLELKSFKEETVYTSYLVIKELEMIEKKNKDEHLRFRARKTIALLKQNFDNIVVAQTNVADSIIKSNNIKTDADSVICATAAYFGEDCVFHSNDLSRRELAKKFGVTLAEEKCEEEYKGYIEVEVDNDTLASSYMNPSENIFDLLINEYAIVKQQGLVVDTFKWTGTQMVKVSYSTLNTNYFGLIKPADIYQQMLLDSFKSNQITLVSGKPGSGKSYLSLAYLFYLKEKGKIDKIIIFCNPVPAMGTMDIGLLPGSKDEKLLDSSIGNFLVSKLGSIIAVEKLINDGELVLLPMSSIRGFDTGSRSGIYITECQNTTAETMRLALTRVGEGSIVILDGDNKSQLDMEIYKQNNGMTRVSEVFKGSRLFGKVELAEIHRSAIAELADML